MKLMQMAQEHMPIAQENALRKATQIRAQMGMSSQPQPGQPGAPTSPVDQLMGSPGATPGGTASQSQQVTNLAPNVPATQPA
jgi:hypothetical protein